MCRNIRPLFNFEPPATDDEVRAASLQFVRKLSGFNAPSRANEAAFQRAVDDVSAIARRLVDELVTTATPRDRVKVAAAARARGTRADLRGTAGRGSTSGQDLDPRQLVLRRNREQSREHPGAPEQHAILARQLGRGQLSKRLLQHLSARDTLHR